MSRFGSAGVFIVVVVVALAGMGAGGKHEGGDDERDEPGIRSDPDAWNHGGCILHPCGCHSAVEPEVEKAPTVPPSGERLDRRPTRGRGRSLGTATR
jgi:hypothetical protein